MSNIISNQINEQVSNAPPRGEKVLSKGELFSTSLGVMTMTASQMLESFGVQTQNSSCSANSDFIQDDLMTQMMLDDQIKRLEKGERMEEAFIRVLAAELIDPKKSLKTEKMPAKGPQYQGKEAIFKAAGLVSQLQKNAQDSLVQQMEDQLEVMQEQLKVLEEQEAFVSQFKQDWDAFKKDPSEANFDKLINLLKAHYAGDPEMLAEINELIKDEQAAKGKNDKHAMKKFDKFANKMFNEIELQIFGNEPQRFSDFMVNGQKAFTKRIQEILTQMSKFVIILAILQGGDKDAIFKVEGLLMSLMEVAIKSNADKNKDQAKMTDINIQIQQQNYEKAEKDLEKLKAEEKPIGFFGWIKDFVKLIVDIVVAASSIIACGVVELGNLCSGEKAKSVVHKLLTFAKTHGEAILSNPTLKVVADVAMFAIVVAACISGQFWLAGIMTVLFVMNNAKDSDGHSLMSDATTCLAKGIQWVSDKKISEDTAKAIADAIVVVIVSALTFGAGAPAAIAEEGAEGGIEMADLSANIAEEGAAQAGDEVTQVGPQVEEEIQTAMQKAVKTLQKALECIKRAPGKIGEMVGSRAGTAMMTGGMFMGATNFASDFAKAIAKNDEKLQEIITTILEVVTVLASLAGGLGALSGDVAAINTKLGTFLRRIAPAKLLETIDANAASLSAAAPQIMTGSMITQGITTILRSGDQILVGEIQRDLKWIQGLMALMSSAENIVGQMMKSNQSDLKKITEEEVQFVKNMNAPALASLGNAHALEQLA